MLQRLVFSVMPAPKKSLQASEGVAAIVCDTKEGAVNCGPRGGTGGAKPGSGVQRFWGLGIRPLVSVIRGLGNPFPEAP